ncbi:TraR/DksA family transcriptional regulator [Nocardioides pacificus]
MTTHTLSTAPAHPRAPLLELPDPGKVDLTAPGEVSDYLLRLETARRQQLDALPATSHDPVSTAYRATVERLLHEAGTARARMATGGYGTCVTCDGRIPMARLQMRPWAVTCVGCSGGSL